MVIHDPDDRKNIRARKAVKEVIKQKILCGSRGVLRKITLRDIPKPVKHGKFSKIIEQIVGNIEEFVQSEEKYENNITKLC